ncbi:MAG: hypothetical protein DI598_07500 [Pseudopedobacter saltans]|uniref:DUF5683 domain-containing protein n=1 Tax=Pseudopedobacter saltans TaxID=151895 RepID=A0A2W5H6W7_9SPHI|nr:MAG: hypothetical protein DI598_07500 [Pseudopedobacter saltans]
MLNLKSYWIALFLVAPNFVSAQEQNADSIKKNYPNPKKATIRSLILPGWGQVYNKQYWKAPIALGAVTVPAVLFFNNKNEKNNAQKNYMILVDAIHNNTGKIDYSKIQQLDEKYLTAFEGSKNYNLLLSSVQSYRNQQRKYQDYAALWCIIFWGLNVADATVSAHLKHFDISPNLFINSNGLSSNVFAAVKVNWKYIR